MATKITLPSRELLERLIEEQRQILFSAAAIVRQSAKTLTEIQSPTDGHVTGEDASEVRRALEGAQKLIEDATGALDLTTMESEAAHVAELEAFDKQVCAEGRMGALS